MTALVALPSEQMAAVAPNWHAMQTAIATCERVDEIKDLADKAVALRAYFAQSRDVDNEIVAMRIRLRAERRLGELIGQEQQAGRLAKPGGDGRNQHGGGPSSTTTTLNEIGIPRDRSARAQELARVPVEQFEAALHNGKPSARSIAALAPPKGTAQAARQPQIDVQPVLKTWGVIRDFAAALADGSMLSADGWASHPGIQPFQVAEIRAAIPIIGAYLDQLARSDANGG